jgi:hypothetical protein
MVFTSTVSICKWGGVMPRRAAFFFLAVLLMFAAGCGTKSGLCKPNNTFTVTYSKTSPSLEEISAGVPPEVAAVCIIRVPQFVACAAPMYFQIDGEEIGPLATHTHMVDYVPPGEHEVTAVATSIWNVKTRSIPGRVRIETFPGRVYFVSGVFDEGFVDVRQISAEEAAGMLAESRLILTGDQEKKP